jgi:hypothetical protein
VHTTFNQAVAATGRLSSSDPNLQNIPIRSRWGARSAAAFIAEQGERADQRRLLADRTARAGPSLTGTRRSSKHSAMRRTSTTDGSARYSAPTAPSAKHELRRRAKIINYALLYGKTAFTLAKDIGVTQAARRRSSMRISQASPRSGSSSTSLLEEGRRPAWCPRCSGGGAGAGAELSEWTDPIGGRAG